MGDTPIGKLLLKLSPPVMLALLIQSIYNIVDSYFVARYSLSGLTALSVIYPIQLLMTSLGTGVGTGLGILVSRMDGTGDTGRQRDLAKSGQWLGLANALVFAAAGALLVEGYFALSSDQPEVRAAGVQYGRIIFLGSLGLFVESNCTKLLQAKGNMLLPMLAQVAGAVINLVLDPVLIFGLLGAPELGVAGAAAATVLGQWAAMGITLAAVWRTYGMRGRLRFADCRKIFRCGLPSIAMQSLYTLYIIGLNLILKQFTEDAVTVLGIYYKLQAFFFIPLMGLQQVIVPVISYNHGAGSAGRVRETLRCAVRISVAVMALATAAFWAVPEWLLSIFSPDAAILAIGVPALRRIALSFVPAGATMMLTVYFQGVDRGKSSLFVTVLRQVVLLVPLAWVLHFWGLGFVWLTFPLTELAVLACSLVLYRVKRLPAGLRP